MNAIRLLVAVALLLSATSANAAKVLRLAVGTDALAAGSVLANEEEGLVPWGASLAFDFQRDGSHIAIAPFIESYRGDAKSISYAGLNVLLSGDITTHGVYGGLGGGVARLRSWETSSYSPMIDVVLGGRSGLSSTARLIMEGKFMINTATEDTYDNSGDFDFGNEIILTLGIAVTL